MPTLEVLRRTGDEVRYRVLYEDGRRSTTTKQMAVEVGQAQEEAKRKHTRVDDELAKIIGADLKIEGVKPVIARVNVLRPVEPEAESVEVQPRVEYVLADHEHDDKAAKDHPHSGLEEADKTLARGVMQLQERLDGVAAREYAPVEHPHTSLAEAIVFAQETTSRLSLKVGELHEGQLKEALTSASAQTKLTELRGDLDVLANALAGLRGQVAPLLGLVERIETLEAAVAKPPVVVQHDHDNRYAPMEHPHPEKADSQHPHPFEEHEHEVKFHEHEAKAHAHPEIVGLFTPAQKKTAAQRKGAHLHRFDTMEGDGKGWKCGICGVAKADVDGG